MASDKKPRAVPNPNPCGLSARETEIAVLAWKCHDADGKVNKDKLAKLAHIPQPDSAARMWRMVKAKIMDAATEPTATPGTPKGAGGDDAAAAAADPESPSVVASKKKKAAAAAFGGNPGKVAGRKRTMKEAEDGGSGDEGDSVKAEGGERPKKVAKHVKAKPIVTLKKDAEGGVDAHFEAGEV